MVHHILRAGALLVAAAALSGCGSFFDDLNAAAAVQDQWHAQDQAAQTDYAAACHTYGCGNGAANSNTGTTTPTRPSGCPYGSNSTSPSGGTACPQ